MNRHVNVANGWSGRVRQYCPYLRSERFTTLSGVCARPLGRTAQRVGRTFPWNAPKRAENFPQRAHPAIGLREEGSSSPSSR